MNAHSPPPTVDISKYTGKYIALRDKIKEIEARHKEELAPYKQALDQLNTMLLSHLNTINADTCSVKGVGTVYRTAKKSASIADTAEFRRWVIGGEEFDMVDWRANPTATEAFINEHSVPPPGVNYSVTHVVGVRRS